MFVIIDKDSARFYKSNAYVPADGTGVTLFVSFARKFRTKENAEKFIAKKLPREVKYEVVSL